MLSELEVRKQYQIKVSNRFAALKDFIGSEDMNRPWGNIKENIKTSAQETLGLNELKHHRIWFDECLQFYTKVSVLNCSGYRIKRNQCR
jgi:hypothetical protein